MITYLRALNVEFFKLKRSFAWLIVILAPLVMIFNGASNFVRFQDILVRQEGVAWLKLYVQIVIWYSILLLPMSIGVLSILLSRTEHSENSWKYLLALPIPRNVVYLAKMTNIIILTGISILFLAIGIYISGKILGITEPVPYSMIFGNALIGWLVCFPIIAIQLWLSIRFMGIGIPMGVSAATAIAGVLITNSQYAKFYLWSYPALSMLPKGQGFHVLPYSQTFIESLIVFILINIFGIWEFNKRDIQ